MIFQLKKKNQNWNLASAHGSWHSLKWLSIAHEETNLTFIQIEMNNNRRGKNRHENNKTAEYQIG